MAFAAVVGFIALRDGKVASYSEVRRAPCIDPDYSGTIVPPNIAPMNFIIKEDAERYCTKIYAAKGDTIRINSGSPRVLIPRSQWRKLLQLNRGSTMTIDIYARKTGGSWSRFDPIVNRISSEDIDGYLVYRKILGHQTIPDMVIAQRTVANFDERVVLDNRTLSTDRLSCINCHSFCNYNPDRMIIHMRGKGQGMLLVNGKKVVKIDTRTKFNKSPASYASWHPSGKLIAFAVMKVNQAIHSVDDPRVVFDEASDLIIYNVETNRISTFPLIADPGGWKPCLSGRRTAAIYTSAALHGRKRWMLRFMSV